MSAKVLKSQPLPKKWDGSPKGCWDQHPKTREICQLPPDGHKIHMRDDSTGVQLMRWTGDPLHQYKNGKCVLCKLSEENCRRVGSAGAIV